MALDCVQIAFRGDDAGSCESANLAIAQTVAAGTLKNVSVTACGPALEQAVSLFKDVLGIDRGLHLTLNAEWVAVNREGIPPLNSLSLQRRPH